MAQYHVLDMHIRHGIGKDIREFKPGDIIDLSPEEAKQLGRTVEPHLKPKAEKEEKKAGQGG
jgi:hypothetical protein